AVLGFDQLPAGGPQQIAQDLAIVLLILHHKNSLCHVCTTCFSTLTGTVNEKVEPRPRSDSTHNRPPCISMIRLEIDKHNPVQPFLRVIDESACWNSSKILIWSAVPMPGPVSHTATLNEPLVAEARIATSPWSVNLIALPTRLRSTCVMRR